jgi:hypothetical protein
MFDTASTALPEMSVNILAGMVNLPFPDAFPTASVEFDFPEFDYSFTAPLVDLTFAPNSRCVTARMAIDETVTMVWRLSGEPMPEGGKMQLKDAAFDFEMEPGKPRAEFIADTVKGLLWLAGPMRLRIPGVRFEGELNFKTPLRESNHLLRHRWAAYLLMIIERAFGREVLIPAEISDKDWTDISFVHRAIVDRSFTWSFIQERLPVESEEQARRVVEYGENSFHLNLDIDDCNLVVAGQKLWLGRTTIEIESALLLNAPEVRQRLKRSDNCEIRAFIRSLDGVAKYTFHDAPHAPDTPWPERAAEFIELKTLLDDRICEAFNNLAASTLAGLTEEERAAITSPLEFEPFPLDGDEEEN